MSGSHSVRRLDLGLIALKVYVVAFFAFLMAPIVVVVIYSFGHGLYDLADHRPVAALVSEDAGVQAFMSSPLAFSLQVEVAAAVLSILIGVPAALALARSGSRLCRGGHDLPLAPLSMPMILLGVALLYYLSWMGLGVSKLSVVLGHTVASALHHPDRCCGLHPVRPAVRKRRRQSSAPDDGRFSGTVTLPMVRAGISPGQSSPCSSRSTTCPSHSSSPVRTPTPFRW
ncbi:MAG: hypothetical protein R3D43_13615 [Tepidamorphaceae bacterium]